MKGKRKEQRKKKWVPKQHRPYLFIWIPAFSVIFAAVMMFWSIYGKQPVYYQPELGVTFSTKYCKELGLDWKKVYISVLDDLNIKLIRLPIYWDEIERKRGTVELENVRWMLDEAQQRNVRIMPVVGRRVPRWPECHPPFWTKYLTEGEIQEEELQMMEVVVTELKDHPAILRWQVQNEPFFSVFGECPQPDEEFIVESIELVRRLDPGRPIVITDSGELSTWQRTAELADILGVSMYRVTWNSFWGYFYYPVPPTMYSWKANLVSPFVSEVINTELQVEPWVPSTILTTSLDDQYRSMDVERFQSNLDYAKRAKFTEIYLWGVEWWYWLQKRYGDSSMWDAGREAFELQEIQ